MMEVVLWEETGTQEVGAIVFAAEVLMVETESVVSSGDVYSGGHGTGEKIALFSLTPALGGWWKGS